MSDDEDNEPVVEVYQGSVHSAQDVGELAQGLTHSLHQALPFDFILLAVSEEHSAAGAAINPARTLLIVNRLREMADTMEQQYLASTN